MKLGEALNYRSQLQQRLNELRQRIAMSLSGQEDDTPPYEANVLLAEALDASEELEDLVVRINRTNLQVQLENGLSITEAIAKRDALGGKFNTYHTAAQQALSALSLGQRYSRTEIKFVLFVDPQELQKVADGFAQERRELDGLLQAANWSNDLIG